MVTNFTYKLIDVKNKETNKTRIDGRYPLRIGSTYHILLLEQNLPAYLDYITDNKNNKKTGTLKTSMVEDFDINNDTITITTHNSIYVLKEINDEYRD